MDEADKGRPEALVDLVGLIRKRHEGPGWQVFTELWDGTGGRARRRADAVAMGLWPSRGYEIHGYECKETRGDVRKELTDPSKADAVGKYCDFWWLVLAKEELSDGLIVPPSWGVLVPRQRVLRVVRPAPKRKTVPVDRKLVAAMVRTITKAWVPRVDHQALLDRHHHEINEALQLERSNGHDTAKRELEALRAKVALFEKASGLEIAHGWRHPEIGQAVRDLLDANHLLQSLQHRVAALRSAADMQTKYAKECREVARALEGLLPPDQGETS